MIYRSETGSSALLDELRDVLDGGAVDKLAPDRQGSGRGYVGACFTACRNAAPSRTR